MAALPRASHSQPLRPHDRRLPQPGWDGPSVTSVFRFPLLPFSLRISANSAAPRYLCSCPFFLRASLATPRSPHFLSHPPHQHHTHHLLIGPPRPQRVLKRRRLVMFDKKM